MGLTDSHPRLGEINRLLLDINHRHQTVTDVLREGDIDSEAIERIHLEALDEFIAAVSETLTNWMNENIGKREALVATRHYGLDLTPALTLREIELEYGVGSGIVCRTYRSAIQNMQTEQSKEQIETIILQSALEVLQREDEP